MIDKRPYNQLGGANHGWLNAKHHFSFASYYDPAKMGWGSLRVWNDDEIKSQTGFPPHPHNDMEIITYVREGAITHQDSLGNKGRTEAGDVQVMSAGTGIRHSEYNLESDTTKIFQIWVEPSVRGEPPAWGAKPFPKGDRAGKFVTLASGFKGDEDALLIRTPACWAPPCSRTSPNPIRRWKPPKARCATSIWWWRAARSASMASNWMNATVRPSRMKPRSTSGHWKTPRSCCWMPLKQP